MERETPIQLARRRRSAFLPGEWSEQQLRSLNRVLEGSGEQADFEALPDLSGFSSEQLEYLEERAREVQASASSTEPANGTRTAREASTPSRPSDASPPFLPRAEDDTQQVLLSDTPPQPAFRIRRAPSPHSAAHRQVLHRDREELASALMMLMMGGAMTSGLNRLLAAPMPYAGGDESKQGSFQLQDAAVRQLYAAGKAAPAKQECAICYMDIDEAVALPCAKTGSCKSYFHLDCIRPWLEKNPSCPLCRCDCKDLVESNEDEPPEEVWPMGPLLVSFAPVEVPVERPRDLEFVGRGSMPMADVRAMLSGRERLQSLTHDGLLPRGTTRASNLAGSSRLQASRSAPRLPSLPQFQEQAPPRLPSLRQFEEHAEHPVALGDSTAPVALRGAASHRRSWLENARPGPTRAMRAR